MSWAQTSFAPTDSGDRQSWLANSRLMTHQGQNQSSEGTLSSSPRSNACLENDTDRVLRILHKHRAKYTGR